MRILYVHRTRGGGAEGAHIRQVIKALKELGHEVRLLSFSKDTDPLVEIEKKQASQPSFLMSIVHKITFNIPPFVFELLEIAYNLIFYFRIKKAIEEVKPDFIYERYSMFTFVGMRLAKRYQLPIIMEINDSAVVPRVRPLVFTRLGRYIEKKLFTQVSGLIFVSTEFYNLCYKAHGPLTESVVSPNAADLTVFNIDLFDRQQIRKELGVEDKVVCGYIGAFVHWHGIEQFVRAIASKLKQHPNLVLLLIGDGVSFATVKQFIHDRGLENQVLLPGRVLHEDVARMVAAMDYSVLPNSATYNSPMKLFEAMAMGVPAIAPNYGPIEEVIEDNKTGWLFDIGNMDQCVEQVLKIAADTALQKQVGEAAKAYIYNERQWIHNANDILQLYKNSQQKMSLRAIDQLSSGPLGFMSDMRFKQEIYQNDTGRPIPLIKILLSDGTSANFLYRLMRFFARHHLKPIALIVQYINKLLNHCVIGIDADLGPQCVFLHPTGVIINSKVRGEYRIAIESGVVIGDEKGHSPRLQHDIFIGAGAKILGPIKIAENVKVGANAVVVKSISAGATAVGIPARELPSKS